MIHACAGNPEECEHPAVCDQCGAWATAENPVFVSDDLGELPHFYCGRHGAIPKEFKIFC